MSILPNLNYYWAVSGHVTNRGIPFTDSTLDILSILVSLYKGNIDICWHAEQDEPSSSAGGIVRLLAAPRKLMQWQMQWRKGHSHISCVYASNAHVKAGRCLVTQYYES